MAPEGVEHVTQDGVGNYVVFFLVGVRLDGQGAQLGDGLVEKFALGRFQFFGARKGRGCLCTWSCLAYRGGTGGFSRSKKNVRNM